MERSKAIQAIIRLSVATDAATGRQQLVFIEAGSWQALFGGWYPFRRVGSGPVQAISRRIIRIIGAHFLRHDIEKISMNLFWLSLMCDLQSENILDVKHVDQSLRTS